jgi:hypothetical protein
MALLTICGSPFGLRLHLDVQFGLATLAFDVALHKTNLCLEDDQPNAIQSAAGFEVSNMPDARESLIIRHPGSVCDSARDPPNFLALKLVRSRSESLSSTDFAISSSIALISVAKRTSFGCLRYRANNMSRSTLSALRLSRSTCIKSKASPPGTKKFPSRCLVAARFA